MWKRLENVPMQQEVKVWRMVLLLAQALFQQALGLGGVWFSSRPSPGVLLIWNPLGPLQGYYGLETKYVVWAETHGRGAMVLRS